MNEPQDKERRSRVIQSALLLGVLVFAIYGAFILLVHLRG